MAAFSDIWISPSFVSDVDEGVDSVSLFISSLEPLLSVSHFHVNEIKLHIETCYETTSQCLLFPEKAAAAVSRNRKKKKNWLIECEVVRRWPYRLQQVFVV